MLSTTGVAISKHYSAGHLFDVAIWGEAESCCAPGCDCCETDFEYIHVSDNFEVPATQDIQIAVLSVLDNFQYHIVLFDFCPEVNSQLHFFQGRCQRKDAFPLPSEIPALTQCFRC